MRKNFAFIPVLVATALVAVPTLANTCTAKRLKVKHVCGVVVDGSGMPIQGATLQLVSDHGRPLTTQVVTQSSGRFSLDDAPTGNLFLAITAPQHNSGRWPLKVTGNGKLEQCSKPLKVHLASALGWGCGDWVDKE
jgi:uncharacterized protein (DUF2249 family)